MEIVMKKKYLPKLLLAASLALLSPSLFAATPLSIPKTCNDVLLGVQNRFNGYDSWRMIKMTISDEHGNVKTRTITATHRNNGINRILRSRVLAPNELADTEAYALDYFEKGKNDKVWRYLPASKKLLDVQSKDLSSRLYGSDMNIGEMLIRLAHDYDCKTLGEGEYQGLPVYKIYVSPNNQQEIIRLGLKDGEVWVEKTTFLPVYSVFNADSPNEQRIFETFHHHWVDGVYVANQYHIATLKDGRKVSHSVFQVYGERFNLGLPSEWYDVKDLGNLQSTWRSYRTPGFPLTTLP
jgi:hypothetical protein